MPAIRRNERSGPGMITSVALGVAGRSPEEFGASSERQKDTVAANRRVNSQRERLMARRILSFSGGLVGSKTGRIAKIAKIAKIDNLKALERRRVIAAIARDRESRRKTKGRVYRG